MTSSKPSLDDLRIRHRAEGAPVSRAWLVVVAAVVLVLIGAGIWWYLSSSAIEVSTVVARELVHNNGDRTVLNASGYVVARRRATVSSKVTGKVTEVLIEEGMRVKEGQVLARLDDTNLKTSLDVAGAQLESTKTAVDETRALLHQADLEYKRTKRLAEEDIASQANLERAEAEAKSLQARLARQERDVAVAERQVAMWQQQVEDMIIRAPFEGIVTTKNAQPGEMISPVSAGGGFTRTGIGTIVDMDSLEIEVDVNESYINRVEADQPVAATLDAYPEWKIPCKVIAIVPTADRQKSTVKVRVGFDTLDPRILPQMAVKVAFRDAGEGSVGSSVLIPKESILDENGQDVVFVFRNGKAERRAVTAGSAQEDEVALSAGVSAGEKIIVDASSELTDGAAVKERNP